MVLAWIRETTVATVNTIELVAIVYLAIAISGLRERVSKIEGRMENQGKEES